MLRSQRLTKFPYVHRQNGKSSVNGQVLLVRASKATGAALSPAVPVEAISSGSISTAAATPEQGQLAVAALPVLAGEEPA